ncbi:MAG: 50S ribosomal protein L25/general stress protein Ctc [Chromatiales bacterium]|nr:50S ribosomal protein L25/general stress protein Ctc [Chromatiales bacterium]
MSQEFKLAAETRTDAGKGASRRLRRAGRVPAILYGGGEAPQPLTFEANELMRNMAQEAFFSSILTINVGGQAMQAVIRDVQMHPARRLVWHLDLQRILATEKLRLSVPLHFLNEATAKAVKERGAVFSHLITEIEVECLPRNLPEYIKLDVANMELDQTLHLSDITLPEGVEIPELAQGTDHDLAVISLHLPRVQKEESEETGEGEAGNEEKA